MKAGSIVVLLCLLAVVSCWDSSETEAQISDSDFDKVEERSDEDHGALDDESDEETEERETAAEMDTDEGWSSSKTVCKAARSSLAQGVKIAYSWVHRKNGKQSGQWLKKLNYEAYWFLAEYFDKELLDKTKFIFDARMTEKWGKVRLTSMDIKGQTFLNKVYIKQSNWLINSKTTREEWYKYLKLLAHELTHVEQYKRASWKIREFGKRYMYHWCRAGRNYAKNKYEKEARERSEDIIESMKLHKELQLLFKVYHNLACEAEGKGESFCMWSLKPGVPPPWRQNLPTPTPYIAPSPRTPRPPKPQPTRPPRPHPGAHSRDPRPPIPAASATPVPSPSVHEPHSSRPVRPQRPPIRQPTRQRRVRLNPRYRVKPNRPTRPVFHGRVRDEESEESSDEDLMSSEEFASESESDSEY